MRKALVGAVGMLGLVIVAGFSAYALAAPKGPTKRSFTETYTGAQISTKGASSETVYKIVSSLDGTGAGIEDDSTTGLGGTGTYTTYSANGVGKGTDTYKFSVPNASGISAFTGSGKCAGGTGVHKKEKCTYTFTGTLNVKTNVGTYKITGTDTR
jgi:hypothetical protein